MKTKATILSFLMIFILILFSCKSEKKTTSTSSQKQEWAIVIHGGAGGITREDITTEMDKEYRAAL